MRVRNTIVALGALALLLAACGSSSPGQTQGSGQTQGAAPTDGGTNPTDGPGPTQGGGGGGNKPAGWDQNGKVHIEIGGPAQHTGDYGFVPQASIFGGAQGSSLSFAIEGTSELVSILVGQDGSVLVSFASDALSVPAAECTTSNWNIGATSGSGSFDCTAAFGIVASGATLTGFTVKGTFDAHV